MSDARRQLAALVSGGDDEFDLAEAALLIAQEEYPTLDVDYYLGRLDALAAEAGNRLRSGLLPAEAVARLNHFLFVEQRFRGNNEQYYDARNSYLNEVLDRRTGIPIALSIVYIGVAQRLDLPVYGVSFPGHFLVKYASAPEILIDPFFGKVISTDECADRLTAIYGPSAKLDPRLLVAARPRDILTRMLSNLKQIYVEQHDLLRALACVDRILLLAPDTPRELRDRGVAEGDGLARRGELKVRAGGRDRHRRGADRRLVEIELVDRRVEGDRLAVCQRAELVHGHASLLDHGDVGRCQRRCSLQDCDLLRRPGAATVGVVVQRAGGGVVNHPIIDVVP